MNNNCVHVFNRLPVVMTIPFCATFKESTKREYVDCVCVRKIMNDGFHNGHNEQMKIDKTSSNQVKCVSDVSFGCSNCMIYDLTKPILTQRMRVYAMYIYACLLCVTQSI